MWDRSFFPIMFLIIGSGEGPGGEFDLVISGALHGGSHGGRGGDAGSFVCGWFLLFLQFIFVFFDVVAISFWNLVLYDKENVLLL